MVRAIEERAGFQNYYSEPAPHRRVLQPAPRRPVWYEPIYQPINTAWSARGVAIATGAVVVGVLGCCFFGFAGLLETIVGASEEASR